MVDMVPSGAATGQFQGQEWVALFGRLLKVVEAKHVSMSHEASRLPVDVPGSYKCED